MMLIELAKEAGLPDGVVNAIHGQHEGTTKSRDFQLKMNSFSRDIHLR